MLNKLSLPPEENSDDAPGENSERRMLRALEALSGPRKPQDAAPPPQDQQKPGQHRPPPRENFRPESSHHGNIHANKGRHRFVRDGEVPVVHMSVPRPAPTRSDADWSRVLQLHEEQRQRADQAERGRADALNQIKTLQTKLAHAELALDDAQKLAQARLEELTAVQAALEERSRSRPTLPHAGAEPIAEPVKPPVAQPINPTIARPVLDPPLSRPVAAASIQRAAPPPPPPARPIFASPPPAAPSPARPASQVPAKPARPAAPVAAPPAAQPPVVKRGPGRPRLHPLPPVQPEPEPVQWWLLPTKAKRR